MAVLKTTSPTAEPSAPTATPVKTLPSSRAKMAGTDKQTSRDQWPDAGTRRAPVTDLSVGRPQKGEMVDRISPDAVGAALVAAGTHYTRRADRACENRREFRG